MKKLLFSLVISLTFVFGLVFMSDVYAYEENTFTNGQCINNNSYLTSATTEYTLSEETGTYSLSGMTYSEYQNSGKKNVHLFYIASNDGKVLYGLVPNYNTAMANDSVKTSLFNDGIVTTANCDNIYVMQKTVVGNAPSDSSYINFGNSSNSNTNNNSNKTKTNTNKSKLDDSTSKLNSPNTASPMIWSVILVSLVLVSVGAYSLYKKSNSNN